MAEQINLVITPSERTLLLDLLLREQRELPVEIHHTRRHEAHDDLEERLKLVNGLIQRLQAAAAPAPAGAS